jgi:hypothetical protein
MASVCRECGESFTPARSDAAYCSSPCRQRAYRRRATRVRNVIAATGADPTRPVPVADDDWARERFWEYGNGDPWADRAYPGRRGTGDHPAIDIQRYVFCIASIATKSRNDEDYPYDVDEPLPWELPEDITPEHADILASWLQPALDRAAELLVLLQGRSRETTWR